MKCLDSTSCGKNINKGPVPAPEYSRGRFVVGNVEKVTGTCLIIWTPFRSTDCQSEGERLLIHSHVFYINQVLLNPELTADVNEWGSVM